MPKRAPQQEWSEETTDSATNSDRRREIKLIMPVTNIDRLHMWLRTEACAFSPVYQSRWVNNIYFDTEEFASLFESVEGDCRRLKVRLRWYGDLQQFNESALEFKCKIGLIGWKRSCRIHATFDLAVDSWRIAVRRIAQHAAPEHRSIFEQVCRPALINRYFRSYYLSFDRSIRVTVDRQMRFWSQIAGMKPNLSRAKRFDDYAVIEFKASPERGLELGKAIHALGARCDKHSKYVTGMTGALRVMH